MIASALFGPILLMAAEAAHGAHETSGGLPQLNPDHFAGQLFWLALTFLFLYFVLSQVAIPRIGTVIEERRDKIADDIDRAAEFKAQADAAIKAYEQALADARARARVLADESRNRVKAETDRLRMDAEAKLNDKLVAAEVRIAKTKKDAMASVTGLAAEAAVGIVARLIGDTITMADAEKAVTSLPR